MTLPLSDTVQLPGFQRHFNSAPLDWTDRGTQTRGTRAYSPFICNLRRTVAADIALPMDAVSIDVTRVEVALRFRLATIAIYRSSAGVCNPWATDYGPSDNCLCGLELFP
ncbi:uncharacterized protein TNCV_1485441 [Trichonephila clavipes]|nr:uncharacterized protein TNCV_1485441 [Trichonephila clavipes]